MARRLRRWLSYIAGDQLSKTPMRASSGVSTDGSGSPPKWLRLDCSACPAGSVKRLGDKGVVEVTSPRCVRWARALDF